MKIISIISLLFLSVKCGDLLNNYHSARFLNNGFFSSKFNGRYGDTKSTCKDIYCWMDEGQQFKAYRPELFEALRAHSATNETSYERCLSADHLECLSADSKSGQAFWRSDDGLIVVKTIKQYECINMRQMLDSYAVHVLTTNQSCMARVLGLYRVKDRRGRKVYFLVTKNVYKGNNRKGGDGDAATLMTLDLKGSTVGRAKAATSSVLKDLDLLNSGRKLRLGAAKPILLRTLARDALFLSRHGLMDYSVLTQVEKTPGHATSGTLRRFIGRVLNPHVPQPEIDSRGKLVLLGEDGCIYHFGVVDFLQKYTLRKYLETLVKGLYCDARRISCVSPRFYAQRMLQFFDDVTE